MAEPQNITLSVVREEDADRIQNELIDKRIVWYKHKDQRAIAAMAFLVIIFCAAEFTFGIFSNSLALISDAFHMLSDLIGLIIGFFAIQLSRRAATGRQSYGWVRAEVIGGLVNGVFLIAVCLFIILEAIQRYIDPPEITDPMLVIIVGAGGLAVNVIGLIMFASHSSLSHGHSHSHGHGHGHGHADKKTDKKHKTRKHAHNAEDAGEVGLLEKDKRKAREERDEHLHDHDEHEHEHAHEKEGKKEQHKKDNSNLHAVFLHVLGDALGSVGAIGTGLIIKFVDHPWKVYADPTFSVLLTLIILKGSIPLVKHSANILLESVPENIDLEALSAAILKIEGVVNVHELHVWQLGDVKNIATLHAAIDENTDFPSIAETIKILFHDFGVHSTTIQPEYVSRTISNKVVCKMACEPECAPQLCCEPTVVPQNNTYGTL